MVGEVPPEDRNTAEERGGDEFRNEEPTLAEKEASVASSVLRNLNVFRDFFLAAFSDGYHVSQRAVFQKRTRLETTANRVSHPTLFFHRQPSAARICQPPVARAPRLPLLKWL
jgi:hypothetical protein